MLMYKSRYVFYTDVPHVFPIGAFHGSFDATRWVVCSYVIRCHVATECIFRSGLSGATILGSTHVIPNAFDDTFDAKGFHSFSFSFAEPKEGSNQICTKGAVDGKEAVAFGRSQ